MQLNNNSVSPIISMILLVTIMLIVVGAIIQWATPNIQNAISEANYRANLQYTEKLLDSIDTIRYMGVSSTETVSIFISKGEFYFMSNDERWIFSYGLNNTTRIIFSELGVESNDNTFKINSTISMRVNISINWYNNNYEQIHSYITVNRSINSTATTITTNRILEGILCITVYNSSTFEESAELWLFDLTSLNFKFSSIAGNYITKLVNNGNNHFNW